MKKNPYLLSVFLIPFFVAGQKSIPDFGKIDIADLQLSSCMFEPDADAMKLFDVQEVEFDPSDYMIRITTERRVRIKIFNERGYKNASINIPYFSKKRSTKIKDLDGVIYNLDSSGKIVVLKLSKKDFFKEKQEENIGVINFTFPNLRPGSVIEFRYKKVEKNTIQIDPWIAQDQIPTAYASSLVTIPAIVDLSDKVFGADTLEKRISHITGGRYDRTKNIYFRENIHSFQPEPFMSSYRDNLLRVVFLLLPAKFGIVTIHMEARSLWKMAGKALMELPEFGGQLNKDIPGTKLVIDSAKAIPTIPERLAFLYEYVKKRLSDKAEQTLYPGNLIEAWNNQSANTAETNMILLNLLRKSGVKAFPLLISTRDHGKVDMNFPSLGQLNGIDILVSDSSKVYILDASLKFQSPYNPPFNILNRNALLLNEGNMQWIMVDDDRPLVRQITNIQASLNEDGKISGTAYSWYHDYAKSYLLDTASQENAEDKFFDKNPQGLKVISIKQQNQDNLYKPLEQEIAFTYEPQQTGDFYFINPQLFAANKENPFVKDNRITDIDLGCNQELSLKMNLSIPPGFQVDHLPQNILVRAPDSSFLFRRSIIAESSEIFLQQSFEIKQSLFYRDQYPGIQEFFKRVYALMSEEIVLKKKK
jgi:Domain of Unknown Function with PDB structure (DUF3857)